MSKEESRPGAGTETTIKDLSNPSSDSTGSASSTHSAMEAKITRLERELADELAELRNSAALGGFEATVFETGVAAQNRTEEKPTGGNERNIESVVEDARRKYMDSIRDKRFGLRAIRDSLLTEIKSAVMEENAVRNKSERLAVPKALDELTIVETLLARHHIARVNLSGGRDGDNGALLAIYEEEGPNKGLYADDEDLLARLISELAPGMDSGKIKSAIKRMRYHAPRRGRTLDAHLIPVNNGIFDHSTKTLLPFSPDYVFLAKSPVDYDPDAESPVITMPDGEEWEVGKWIADLSDDDGVPELLWEIISAVVRPGERWNKAVFLHSSRGNNGKGTLCSLLRNLVGSDGCASVPIANFSKPFALSELVRARAIITDENPVGAFAKDLGDFKSVITGDKFVLDRKYKDPVSVSFSGLVVQCVNDFPKSRDKSASYTRRQLFVPFRKWFGDIERGYIKSDYLARPEVLRYVLRVALEMDHEQFSNPAACQELLEQFQRENNPVVDFWAEFEDQFVWDLLPTAFLYQLFVAWFRETHPSGILINRNDFLRQLMEIVSDSTVWEHSDCKRPGKLINVPEPLIAHYQLKDWENASYRGADLFGKCLPHPLKANYRGFVRR